MVSKQKLKQDSKQKSKRGLGLKTSTVYSPNYRISIQASTPCLLPQALLSSVLPNPLSLHFLARVHPAHHARFFYQRRPQHFIGFTAPIDFIPHNNSLTCTCPTDDRELSLQELTCSSAPYETMVTASCRVHDKVQRECNFYSGHHRTDALRAHLSPSHGY